EGREVIADDLLKAGADPTLTNDLGETPLVWAMRHGNVSIAKMVGSPEAFANAAREPRPAAPAMRSVAMPQHIEDLLRRIRHAEGQNQPTAGLRKQLATALMRQREDNKRAMAEAERKQAGAVKGIVITAQRQGGGEKAEIVYDNARPAAPAAARPASGAPARQDNIQILLARIRTAKANGQPTDELRKQLMDAVAGYRD